MNDPRPRPWLERRLLRCQVVALREFDWGWLLRTSPLLVMLLVSVALSCAASTPAPKRAETGQAQEKPSEPGSRLELREPKWLPAEGREMLGARMHRHAQDMMLLVASVILLNHDVAAELSDGIADEPGLARPAAGERGTLNALLPNRFFELEDELRERSRAVAVAAQSKDDARLAKAYGQLVETCVSCHAVYLQDRPPSDEPE